MMPYVPAFAVANPEGLTPGFHPTIVPSSVSNRKAAEAEVATPVLVKPLTLNPPVLPPSILKTAPVGVPAAPSGSGGVGMLTTNPLTETGVLLAPGTL